MKNNIKIAKYLRYTSRITLIIIAISWFVFALLSGSEKLGGGLKGILQNIPNALPGLLLFVIVYVAWKRELIGGLAVTLIGLFTIFFFQTYKSLITLLGISLPLIIIGVFLLTSWYLTKNKIWKIYMSNFKNILLLFVPLIVTPRCQAFFRLWIMSRKPGFLPYINIYTLKILMTRNSPTIMESPNTPILVMICQKGMSDTPNLNMVWTGAVTGNIVSTTQMELSGKAKSNEENQSGIKLERV